jgi:hypothetical protein
LEPWETLARNVERMGLTRPGAPGELN